MTLPKVNITLGNGAIGAVSGNDGIAALILSGVAVAGKFALGDILGPFYGLADAVAKGINAAYDTANTTVAYNHIKEFYDEAGEGRELYVMVVAKTVKLSEAADKDLTHAKKLLEQLNGKVKVLGICRTPDNAYAPVYLDQFDSDLWTAATKAQALFTDEFSKGRPVQIVLEGRDFQGTAGTAKDLRDAAGLSCNRVSIAIHQNNTYATANAFAAKYAAVGSILGRLAKIHVGRNIGRVLDGPTVITAAGLSNGAALATFTEVNLGALHDKGYIFLRKWATKSGMYFNSDPVAAPVADDYNSISRGRAIDKVVRITNDVYTNFINDDPELDATTGKLNVAVVKDLQGSLETEVQLQMLGATKEISGIKATVDEAQNVLQTKKVKVKVKVVPKGSIEAIDVDLAYSLTI